ncbi:hypothetical protein [Abyssisolibacter fermentans]|uniref:hypothetical protein n=1 Tax=Abyssisolibacter fermentans TaxID=1766203 RepID=UPI0012E3A76B|nr:hypothetical protein [Abyssisolibacter fermentans]
MSYKPKKKLTIEEFLKPQAWFKNLFKKNVHLIKGIQKKANKRWEKPLIRCNVK